MIMTASDDEYNEDIDDFEKDGNAPDATYEKTKSQVNEGEKTVSLALEVSKQSDELSLLRQETASFRAALLQGISGVTDAKNYEHINLEELLRIRLQEASALHDDSSQSQMSIKDESYYHDRSSVVVIQKLEQKLAQEAQQSDELKAKCIALKDELAAAAKENTGIDNLHVKISEMSSRLRNEREIKSKINKDLTNEKSKVEALSDHIEKLIFHLKHEAISKAKSMSDQSRLQREIDTMKIRLGHMGKKNDRKDKVIAELRETGKMLEDQLRLMDEKFMEIRSKLDWTRSQTGKIVKQKELELQQLREKFELVVESSPKDEVSVVAVCVVAL